MEELEPPFVVHVYGVDYTMKDGRVKVPVPGSAKPKLYERRHPAGKPPESAMDMQKRIEENIVDMARQRVRK